jgi:hypothetical protein
MTASKIASARPLGNELEPSFEPLSGRELHYAPGLKAGEVSRGNTEAAEDFGVVLAKFGGGCADPHRLADPDRRADLWHLAQLCVLAYWTTPRWRTCASANICA